MGTIFKHYVTHSDERWGGANSDGLNSGRVLIYHSRTFLLGPEGPETEHQIAHVVPAFFTLRQLKSPWPIQQVPPQADPTNFQYTLECGLTGLVATSWEQPSLFVEGMLICSLRLQHFSFPSLPVVYGELSVSYFIGRIRQPTHKMLSIS